MTSEKAIEITAPQLALRTVDGQEMQEMLEELKKTPPPGFSESPGGGVILLGPGLSGEEELEP
jgi:hypothetical protein